MNQTITIQVTKQQLMLIHKALLALNAQGPRGPVMETLTQYIGRMVLVNLVNDSADKFV